METETGHLTLSESIANLKLEISSDLVELTPEVFQKNDLILTATSTETVVDNGLFRHRVLGKGEQDTH